MTLHITDITGTVSKFRAVCNCGWRSEPQATTLLASDVGTDHRREVQGLPPLEARYRLATV